jgi:predicted phage terminase large subunit-like protein
MGEKFSFPPHLRLINEALLENAFTPNARLCINLPFQHGKTWLCSHLYPAWRLMLWPELRIILVGHGDQFAASFGQRVKEIVEEWGAPLGLSLRKDTRAKNEWVLARHGGGLVCKGRGGAVVGRPADELIFDDLIKDNEEAASPTLMDNLWEWYQTVAYSRLGPTAGIMAVGTRWGMRDHFGRIEEESRRTGEVWKWIKLKAIATQEDPLGRAPGQALWPERVPLERLQMIQAERPRIFSCCWQQEPVDEQGTLFKPSRWPTYEDLGDTYCICASSHRRLIVPKTDIMTMITVDWAAGTSRKADFTAFGVFGLTPEARLLVFEMRAKKQRPEVSVPELADLCKKYRPSLVAVEDQGMQTSLANECRRHADIPEVYRIKAENTLNAKLRRALPAMIMAENGRICLPVQKDLLTPVPGTFKWDMDGYIKQLICFTGQGDDHDDMVDATSWAAQMADRLKGAMAHSGEPVLLQDGYKPW